jgi:hypothetical protein
MYRLLGSRITWNLTHRSTSDSTPWRPTYILLANYFLCIMLESGFRENFGVVGERKDVEWRNAPLGGTAEEDSSKAGERQV